MSRKLNHTAVGKRCFGMIAFAVAVVISTSAAQAQSYGACIQSGFVSPISMYGGTAAGLAMDVQDNLYVAENVNNVGITPQGPFVSKITPQGVRSIFVPQGVLGDVTALAFDSQGNLYVADGNGTGNGQPAPKNMVWKVSPNGSITPFISGINNPTGLAFDSAGNLYVSSFDDRAVYKYSSSAAFLGAVVTLPNEGIYGIAVDHSGNLFVAGFFFELYKVTPQGQLSIFLDKENFTDTVGFVIAGATNLVFDDQGYLYVSYYQFGWIFRFAPDGSYTLFPGECYQTSPVNGLAIDSHGFLYTTINGGSDSHYALPSVLKMVGIVPKSGTVGVVPAGSNVTVQTDTANFTFDSVATGGTTTVTPIDPATVGQVPGGFAVSNSIAYEISTTAIFTGSVTLAFKVPGPISQEDFDSLAILHNVNGTLVDATASTPPRDYANLTMYATTTSFSPFYLARKGPHIKPLFDQTKAYKSGSTVPIKLQVLDANTSNVSSSSTSLVARDLRLLSSNTTAPIVDSGNANPDSTFRYDSTLGGLGGGYIFNLSTKGLASGQYALSFYVGSERSFFYTVKFEVK